MDLQALNVENKTNLNIEGPNNKTIKKIFLTRAYNLKLYGNKTKIDTMRYTYIRFLQYVNMWCGKLFFNGNKSLSTQNMGALANQAQHKARGIISALFAAAKETGSKINVPIVKTIGCPAYISESKESSFDYWISVENQFTKNRISVPTISYKKLNKSLKDGWILNPVCELVVKKDEYYARVFVQKEVERATICEKTLGCDVGYRNSVSRSDGYIGRNSSKIIKSVRQKQAARQRQGIKSKIVKSRLKQILDIEAKNAIRKCNNCSSSLIVESPKILNNLRSGKLQGWARNYFANRCTVLGRENSVFVWNVNPAFTSQTCSRCGHVDKLSRSGLKFCCTACGFTENADVNAAKNIALRGSESLNKIILRQHSKDNSKTKTKLLKDLEKT